MRKIYHKKCESPIQLSGLTVLCTIEVQDNRCCYSSRSLYISCTIEGATKQLNHLRQDHIYPVGINFRTEEIGNARALQMRCIAGNNRASEASVKGGVLGSGVLGGRIGSVSSYFFVMRDIVND